MKHIKVKIFNGHNANRAKFLDAAKTASIIHFAGHGTYDWNNPYESGLLFASQTGKEKLSLSEMRYHLNLKNTDLVVLSACGTNITSMEDGQKDEYLGLPGAFLLAGARAVVGSLWPVDDVSTMLLMTQFYKELQNGSANSVNTKSTAEALRRAQLWLCRLSKTEIASLVIDHLFQLKSRSVEVDQEIKKWAEETDKPSDHEFPYAHPYYWAAFQAIGDVI